MSKCKITVLKRTLNQDIVDQYAADDLKQKGYGPCDRFRDGQEFILDKPDVVPEGFCGWAFADIQRDLVAIMYGGNLPWIKGGKAIACCTDGFRPVVFRIERVE